MVNQSAEVSESLGVIDSLSAGYRLLGRRFELVLIPLLIDLFIWQAPRLGLSSLFAQLAAFYEAGAEVENVPADLAEMSTEVSGLIGDLGAAINLMTLLANQSLMHVPSLTRVMASIPGQSTVDVGSLAQALGAILLLGALGLLLGTIYLNMLAQRLPIGDGPKRLTAGEFVGQIVVHWAKIIGFVVLLGLALLMLYLIVGTGIAFVAFFIPALSTTLAFLLGGFTFVLFFFLSFTTVAIVLDNLSILRAMGQSVQIVRTNFGATLLFVLLINVISIGFSVILTGLGRNVPFGTLVAILLNAYIGTGLAMALLVFYRTRWLRLVGEGSVALEEALTGGSDEPNPRV